MAILKKLEHSTDNERYYQLRSPANLEPLYEIKSATQEEVQDAITQAHLAQTGWAKTSIKQRIKLLHNLRHEILKQQDFIMDTVIAETGKAPQEAFMFEIYASCDFISYFCKIAKKALQTEKRRPHGLLGLIKKLHINYKPLGVVGVISPWNGPFILCLNPCIQAILAGNTVIAKGSEITPKSASIIQQLFLDAGFPEHVIQVLEGDGQTGADIVNGDINKIVFTGSTRTGKIIAEQCAKRLIPFTLELGGNDAMIICDDANLDHAAHGALWGGCVNSGHFCCGIERVYVEKGCYDSFMEKLLAQAKLLKQGQQYGNEQDLGAIFWDRQLDIIQSHVDDAIKQGATLHCGGAINPDLDGLHYPVTVLSDVPQDCLMMQNETFGPVLAIHKVSDINEAVRLANDSDYGLHGSVWTKNISKGRAIAKQIETGSMAVNDMGIMYGVPAAPFSGAKSSGFGCAHNGIDALRGYCHPQAVVSGRYSGIDNGYPFTEKSFKQLKRISNFLWENPIGRFFSD